MWKSKHLFLHADAGEDAGGNGGDGSVNPDAGHSLLGTGAQAPADEVDWVPEKFRVMGDDGKLNVESSARKLAESYTHLEKRLGHGDAPPKSVDDYAPKVDAEGFQWDEFKADPEMQGFLKAAHAKGITNDQMGFILGEYLQRAPALVNGAAELDADAAGTQLRAVWQSDAEFNKNIGLAYRAFHALADEGDKDRLDDIGNNPLVIRMLAKVGAEMQEDTPAGADANPTAQQVIRDLMKSEAYADPKHADHDRVAAQIRAFYQKTYGTHSVA